MADIELDGPTSVLEFHALDYGGTVCFGRGIIFSDLSISFHPEDQQHESCFWSRLLVLLP